MVSRLSLGLSCNLHRFLSYFSVFHVVIQFAQNHLFFSHCVYFCCVEKCVQCTFIWVACGTPSFCPLGSLSVFMPVAGCLGK